MSRSPLIYATNILTVLGKPLVSSRGITSSSFIESRPLPPGLAGEILEVLSKGPLQIEAIGNKLGSSISDILTELTLLEMDNYVTQKPGKVFERI